MSLWLVTGGAGFLGVNLCRHLLMKGASVRSLDIAAFDYPERSRVEAIEGDIRDRAAVDRAMQDVDIVVHAAAALPLSSKQDIHSTDVDGTGVVLDSAFSHAVSRVIFVSSTSVYGIPTHQPLQEGDPLQGVGPYGLAKIEAEQLCLQQRSRGHCVTILRPKTFVGPERLGAFELLYRWAADGRNFPVLGPGDNRYQLLDVEDLCAVIHLCGTADRELVNDTFNVGAKDFGSLRESFQAVLDRAGFGKKVVSLPAGPSIAILKVLAALRLSPLYPWIYETAAKDSVVSIDKLTAKFGFTPHYSNCDALLRNYDWYVSNRARSRGLTGVSHRLPWKQGALRLAQVFF